MNFDFFSPASEGQPKSNMKRYLSSLVECLESLLGDQRLSKTLLIGAKDFASNQFEWEPDKIRTLIRESTNKIAEFERAPSIADAIKLSKEIHHPLAHTIRAAYTHIEREEKRLKDGRPSQPVYFMVGLTPSYNTVLDFLITNMQLQSEIIALRSMQQPETAIRP